MRWKYFPVGSRYANPKAEPATPSAAGCACGAAPVYSHDYDARFCPGCYRWLERTCGDRECAFCAGRPARAPRPRPSGVRAWHRA